MEIASPYLEKAMAASEPQRLQAADSFRVYKGKFDESVTAPVTEVREEGGRGERNDVYLQNM